MHVFCMHQFTSTTPCPGGELLHLHYVVEGDGVDGVEGQLHISPPAR
jgi:hypothetical protein